MYWWGADLVATRNVVASDLDGWIGVQVSLGFNLHRFSSQEHNKLTAKLMHNYDLLKKLPQVSLRKNKNRKSTTTGGSQCWHVPHSAWASKLPCLSGNRVEVKAPHGSKLRLTDNVSFFFSCSTGTFGPYYQVGAVIWLRVRYVLHGVSGS